MGGVLLVNKPAEISSHVVVKRIRNLFQTRRVGHAGTLDPFATGLLLLCLDEATRITEYLMEGEKEYVGTLKLGETTDTQDCTGQVLETRPVPDLTVEAIQQAFAQFVGAIGQIPPMFSAKKLEGVRLYDLARQGKHVERSARPVTIQELELLDLTLPHIRFRVACSKGTYIRTLAHDVGEALGCGATLHALERTRSGRFFLRDALSLDQLTALRPQTARLARLVPTDVAVDFFPSFTLPAELVQRFVYGTPVIMTDETEQEPQAIYRVYSPTGEFLALANKKLVEPSRWKVRPLKMLISPEDLEKA